MTIADLRDPIAVGNEVTYDVRVINNGSAADQQVVVTVTAPPEMTPVLAGSGGPKAPTIEGQTMKFAALPEIRPGETIRYQVRMRGNRAGTARVRVQLQTRGISRPISAEETTAIVAPNG